jgi:hypothetical protein
MDIRFLLRKGFLCSALLIERAYRGDGIVHPSLILDRSACLTVPGYVNECAIVANSTKRSRRAYRGIKDKCSSKRDK